MTAGQIQLVAGAYALALEPAEGGAVARFEFDSEPLFRPRCGEGPLQSACFPLVPFSNRIAHGRFEAEERVVQLAPNFPGSDHPHPLHGFGWLRPWTTDACDAASATLTLEHAPDAWPWAFRAEQRFILSETGLRHVLSVRNMSDAVMPAGLGAHPYFPRTPRTLYRGLHRGAWETSAEGLPISHHVAETPIDWWDGKAVGSRVVDTVYTARSGPHEITWPERNLRLTIEPDPALDFTVIYTPPDADFFCVEPVSHETDAVNRLQASTGLRWLAPGETFSVEIRYSARRFDARES